MNIEQIINGMADKIETLENKYKYMFNNKDIEHLIDKIENRQEGDSGTYGPFFTKE